MSKPTRVKEVPVVNAAAAPTEAEILSENARRVQHIDRELHGGFAGASVLHHKYRTQTPVLQFGSRLLDTQIGVSMLQDLCYTLSYNAGWHTSWGDSDFCTKIALIHSEISEALEGHRKDKQDDHLPHRKSVEVELADAVIRIMDLAGAMKLDLGGAIIEKLVYNQQRADHTMTVRNGEGGKRF